MDNNLFNSNIPPRYQKPYLVAQSTIKETAYKNTVNNNGNIIDQHEAWLTIGRCRDIYYNKNLSHIEKYRLIGEELKTTKGINLIIEDTPTAFDSQGNVTKSISSFTINSNLYLRRLLFFTNNSLKSNEKEKIRKESYEIVDQDPIMDTTKAALLHEKIMRYQKPLTILSNIYHNNETISEKILSYNNELIDFSKNNYLFKHVDYYRPSQANGRDGIYVIYREIDNQTQAKTDIQLTPAEINLLKQIIKRQINNMLKKYTEGLPKLPADPGTDTEITPKEIKYKIVTTNIEKIKNGISEVNKKKQELEQINKVIENAIIIKDILDSDYTPNENHYQKNRSIIKHNIEQCIASEIQEMNKLLKNNNGSSYFYYYEYRHRKNIEKYQELLIDNKFTDITNSAIETNSGRISDLDNDINVMKDTLSKTYINTLEKMNRIAQARTEREKKEIIATLDRENYNALKQFVKEKTPYHILYEKRVGFLPGTSLLFKDIGPLIKDIDKLTADSEKDNADKKRDEAKDNYKRLYGLEYTPKAKTEINNNINTGDDSYNKGDYSGAITAFDDAITEIDKEATKKATDKADTLKDYLNGRLPVKYTGKKKEAYLKKIQNIENKISSDPLKALEDLDNIWKELAAEKKREAEGKYLVRPTDNDRYNNSNINDTYKSDNELSGLMNNGLDSYKKGTDHNGNDDFLKAIENYSEAIKKMGEVEKVAEKGKIKELLGKADLIADYNIATKKAIYSKINELDSTNQEANNYINANKNKTVSVEEQKIFDLFEEYSSSNTLKENNASYDYHIRNNTVPADFNQAKADDVYTKINLTIKDPVAKHSLLSKLGVLYAIWLKNDLSKNKLELENQIKLFALYNTFDEIKNIAQTRQLKGQIDPSDRNTVFCDDNHNIKNDIYELTTNDLGIPRGIGSLEQARRVIFLNWRYFHKDFPDKDNVLPEYHHLGGYKHATFQSANLDYHLVYLDQEYYQNNRAGRWLAIVTPEGNIVSTNISKYVKVENNKFKISSKLYLNKDTDGEYTISDKPSGTPIEIPLTTIRMGDLVITNNKQAAKFYERTLFGTSHKENIGIAMYQISSNKKDDNQIRRLLENQPRSFFFDYITENNLKYDYITHAHGKGSSPLMWLIAKLDKDSGKLNKLRKKVPDAEKALKEPDFFNNFSDKLRERMINFLDPDKRN